MSIKTVATTCLSLVSFVSISTVTIPVNAVTLLPSDAIVEGKTIAEWTVDWWQYTLSQTNDIFTDPTSGVGQSGPVYYLTSVGYFGENVNLTDPPASEPILRSYNVPKDKFLLIPILNIELGAREEGFDPSEFDDPATATAVENEVISLANTITNLSAEINNVSVTDINDRRYAASFTYNAVPGNSIGVPAGFSGPAYTDGYWLMIAPVGEETFTIDLRGTINDIPTPNNFVVNTSDTVTGVTVPEPTSNLGILATGLLGLVSAFKYKQKV